LHDSLSRAADDDALAGTSTTTAVIRNASDFFTATMTTQTLASAFSTRVTDRIVRVGLNYEFDPFRWPQETLPRPSHPRRKPASQPAFSMAGPRFPVAASH